MIPKASLRVFRSIRMALPSGPAASFAGAQSTLRHSLVPEGACQLRHAKFEARVLEMLSCRPRILLITERLQPALDLCHERIGSSAVQHPMIKGKRQVHHRLDHNGVLTVNLNGDGPFLDGAHA